MLARQVIGPATVALAIAVAATPAISGADPVAASTSVAGTANVPDVSAISAIPAITAIPGLSAADIASIVANPMGNNPLGNSLDELASLVPAILGAAIGPADISSPAQKSILDQAKQLIANQQLPAIMRSMLTSIVSFLDGTSGGGPKLPSNGAPLIAQFLYPSIGKACISDTADSVATALAVPGPAKLPPPGPNPSQAAFVFTALGTKSVAAQQTTPMTVTWINLDNRRTATQTLTDAAKINPGGPATLSAIADTGPGRVVAVISGGLTVQTAPNQTRTCNFLPTVGMFNVA